MPLPCTDTGRSFVISRVTVHTSDTVVADHILKIILRNIFCPERIARHKDSLCDLAGLRLVCEMSSYSVYSNPGTVIRTFLIYFSSSDLIHRDLPSYIFSVTILAYHTGCKVPPPESGLLLPPGISRMFASLSLAFLIRSFVSLYIPDDVRSFI